MAVISGRTGVLAIIADPVVQALAPMLAEQIAPMIDFMTGACEGR